MIRPCTASDLPDIFAIVNDAARAYQGVIPADRWHEPYMPMAELEQQINDGIEFWGYEENHRLVGVMGRQAVRDVTLIRHAYVKTAMRQHGIGGQLLEHLLQRINGGILVGTWRAADWAIRFYEKHGFRLVGEKEKNRLLGAYWQISERQIETSVVLIHRHSSAPTGKA